MSDKQDTPRDDTPRDERRAERDAKRDMLDADLQDMYESRFRTVRTGRFRCDVSNESNGPSTLASDEQETTED